MKLIIVQLIVVLTLFGASKFELQYPTNKHADVIFGFGMNTHPDTNTKFMHNGIDFSVPYQSKVNAAQSGIVTFSGESQEEGLKIIIKHENGFETEYAYLSEIVTVEGVAVKQGDMIGTSGNQILTKEPALHFALKRNGVYVNPSKYFSDNY